MRAALIEFNHYHDEVLPTFVWLLNRLDVDVDVYMVDRSARRGPFAGSAGLSFRQRSVDDIGAFGGLAFRLRRYGLVVVNSMEPTTVLERARKLDAPLLGVVHNTELLIDDPEYRAFFATGRRKPLVLGEHIATRLAVTLGPIAWVSHVVFGSDRGRSAEPSTSTTFAVSGNVEFHRRNYADLLDAASALHASGVPFRVRIIGRSATPDGRSFRADVESHGLADRFEFTEREIDHGTFFELVKGSDFMLPLIDPSRAAFRAYLETKLASSVPFAIGLGVPIVGHTALVAAYDILDTGPTYEDGGLAEAMRRAIVSRPEERAQWRAALAAKRDAVLDASLENLREAIAAVSAAAPG